MDSTLGWALPQAGDSDGASRDRQWSWTCRVVPRSGSRHVLHLTGSLHAGWAGRLAAGLAARNVSVVRATARRAATRWTAEIEVDAHADGVEPSAIDFVALLREAPVPTGGEPVRITGHRVVRTRRDLEVELRAEDRVGFLARTLAIFAELGLFPRELRVETVGSEVRDRFLLQSASGELPPEGIAGVLRRRLEALVDR